jgi:ketosteroid isomerase-like protein
MGGSVKSVRALEQRRHQAMLDADIAALDALLSERLVYTHSNASVDSKTSYLDKVRSKFFDYQEIVTEEEKIVIAGDVVFVFGRMVARVLTDTTVERRLNNRTLGAWAKEGGEWRFVAFQPTPIPSSA